MANLLCCVPQRGVGDFDETFQRGVQFEDEEDRCRYRARAHAEDRDRRAIGRGKQTEADEHESQPEDQDNEQWEGKLAVQLFNQEQAGVNELAYDLPGMGEDRVWSRAS